MMNEWVNVCVSRVLALWVVSTTGEPEPVYVGIPWPPGHCCHLQLTCVASRNVTQLTFGERERERSSGLYLHVLSISALPLYLGFDSVWKESLSPYCHSTKFFLKPLFPNDHIAKINILLCSFSKKSLKYVEEHGGEILLRNHSLMGPRSLIYCAPSCICHL